MLTDEQLQKLLADIEADNVEFTRSTTDTGKFAEAICAFSNDYPNHKKPGYLIIGVDDKTRKLTGLKVTDQLLQNLSAIRSDGNVQPMPAMVVDKKKLPEGEIAIVEVHPSDLPPVRYKGVVYIRTGPRRAIAHETEERQLSERRVALARTFDAGYCKGSNLNDLVLDLFSLTYRPNAIAKLVLDENHRDIELQLASLRFYDLKANSPTYAGILLFGKDALNWMPGAYVQFVRFQGNGTSDPILDEKRLTGDLLTVLRELDQLLTIQIENALVKTSALQEKSMHDYPVIALRELIMNAIIHRSYEATAPAKIFWFEDRIEIQNPGGLYGEASLENFPRQNAYRNPILAEAVKALGYVNKYGVGVARAQEALQQNGNPVAEFSFDPNYVAVTIRKRS